MRLSVLVSSLAIFAATSLVGPRPPWRGPPDASAAVSIQLSVDELVRASKWVVVATAADRYSTWEELGGARRIVTYTRLVVDEPVVGQPGGEVWVRTLGGAVGKVGQQVSGEARIATGARALFFLSDADGTPFVTGQAQGHFPLLLPDHKIPTLSMSPDAGTLLPRRGPAISAHHVLVGTPLDRAIGIILKAQRARDAGQ